MKGAGVDGLNLLIDTAGAAHRVRITPGAPEPCEGGARRRRGYRVGVDGVKVTGKLCRAIPIPPSIGP